RRRIVWPGGAGDDQPGDVSQRADRVVIVEVSAESLLVGKARDAKHHGIAVLALGEERERGGFAAYLVGGVVQIRQVLYLGHRQQAGQPGAQAEADDGLLVEQRVEYPAGAERGQQALGDPVDAALAGYILAEDDDLWMRR